MPKNKLPDNWRGCPNGPSNPINDKFVTFKVPLSNYYCSKLLQDEWFTPEICLKEIEKYNIGLWIDLTYTTRYYNPNCIHKSAIKYVKIPVPGGGYKIPNEIDFQTFVNVVQDFLNTNTDQRIAVHCTHGFNRSGLFICLYLALIDKMPIGNAIRHFSEKRLPGIYRQEYIDYLLKRFNSDEQVIAPKKPDWPRKATIQYPSFIFKHFTLDSVYSALEKNTK